jgi:hypothetical protein
MLPRSSVCRQKTGCQLVYRDPNCRGNDPSVPVTSSEEHCHVPWFRLSWHFICPFNEVICGYRGNTASSADAIATLDTVRSRTYVYICLPAPVLVESRLINTTISHTRVLLLQKQHDREIYPQPKR